MLILTNTYFSDADWHIGGHVCSTGSESERAMSNLSYERVCARCKASASMPY